MGWQCWYSVHIHNEVSCEHRVLPTLSNTTSYRAINMVKTDYGSILHPGWDTASEVSSDLCQFNSKYEYTYYKYKILILAQNVELT